MKWLSFVIAFLCVSFGHALLTVPQNVRATAIGPDAFTLRWDAVDGAESYDVEVKEAVQSLVIDEDFEDLSAINDTLQFPAGWDKQGEGTKPYEYAKLAYSGNSFAIIHGSGDYLRLPQIDNPLVLKFCARVATTVASIILNVESSIDGYNWAHNAILTLTANGNNTGDITSIYRQYECTISCCPSDISYIRFCKSDGIQTVCLDDIQLTAIDLSTPNLSASAATSNAVRVTDLSPETAYIYRVRASNSSEAGEYSTWQLLTTLGEGTNTATGSIIDGPSVSISLPEVGSFTNQSLQITPSSAVDADYTVSVSETDGGLSYSVSCETNTYLNGTYTISHPGCKASGIEVLLGNLSNPVRNYGSTSFKIDSIESKGTFTFSLELQDITLPVEMGNMSLSPIGAHAVNLQWHSHSETNLLGYYVWRSDSANLQDAMLVSSLIPASNNSNGSSYVFQDPNAASSASYWVEAVEYDGASTYHGPVFYEAPEQDVSAPGILRTTLQSIYPNPFNPSTTISYSLKDPQSVHIRIYDTKGRLVDSHEEPAKGPGRHQYIWNAEGAASGVYYVRMRIGEKSFERKIVLLK